MIAFTGKAEINVNVYVRTAYEFAYTIRPITRKADRIFPRFEDRSTYSDPNINRAKWQFCRYRNRMNVEVVQQLKD